MENIARQAALRVGTLALANLCLLRLLVLGLELVAEDIEPTIGGLAHPIDVEYKYVEDDEVEDVADPGAAPGNELYAG